MDGSAGAGLVAGAPAGRRQGAKGGVKVITLRPYQQDDAPALLALFRDTIRRVNSRDYSPAQIAAWASDDIDTVSWFGRFTGRYVPVAEEDGRPVGFAELEPDGHIGRVYVSADHQRRGIGRQLLAAVVAEARRVGHARLFTEVSITARPFFEAQGFVVLAPQVVRCRGVDFINYRMERVMGEFAALNTGSVQAWEALARWWDDTTGEADAFHRTLVIPATDRLLALRPGERVLEAACGNGGYARHLAAQGAEVVAFDASHQFVELAQERTTEWRDRISYRHIDATDRTALLALGERGYDAAVCKMALMDMAVIHPLVSALARLLKPDGRFVFSVPHPAFNSTGTSLWMEETTSEAGELVVQCGVKVIRYLEPEARPGTGIRGQPHPHLYFHRPLSVLLNLCFVNGFVLDGLEEPGFGPGDEGSGELSWARFKEIPPVLVARMRLLER
jgi:2-polyprenyl-3-methyl-5-hydroxy-6-metoxy-1,4-benzoquinol methylase/GNAT superfamily N-acetyltransferase